MVNCKYQISSPRNSKIKIQNSSDPQRSCWQPPGQPQQSTGALSGTPEKVLRKAPGGVRGGCPRRCRRESPRGPVRQHVWQQFRGFLGPPGQLVRQPLASRFRGFTGSLPDSSSGSLSQGLFRQRFGQPLGAPSEVSWKAPRTGGRASDSVSSGFPDASQTTSRAACHTASRTGFLESLSGSASDSLSEHLPALRAPREGCLGGWQRDPGGPLEF